MKNKEFISKQGLYNFEMGKHNPKDNFSFDYNLSVDDYLEDISEKRKKYGEVTLKDEASNFLMKHAGLDYKDFLKELKFEKKSVFDMEARRYLAALSYAEKNGYDIKNAINSPHEGIDAPIFESIQEACSLGADVSRTLSQMSDARIRGLNLNTLISKEVNSELMNKDIHKKLLVGRKYVDSQRKRYFNVILGIESMSHLEALIESNVPIIPIFNRQKIKNLQRYALSLNKKYPIIESCMVVQKGKIPSFSQLAETGYGNHLFVPASYLLVDRD